MKCYNCSCQVPVDFTYAFSMNCCPKCGKKLMENEVKTIYAKMQEVLAEPDSDVGDLAHWLVNTYLPTVKPITETLVEDMAAEESIQPKPSKKPPQPIKTISNASNDRAALFSKRAGVDKIKYETLIKDIQGAPPSLDEEADAAGEVDIEDKDLGDGWDTEVNSTPLSGNEIHAMSGLFDNRESDNIDFNEMQRIQKLEQLQVTGNLGVIRRSNQ